MHTFTKDDVKHIANLASLEVSEEEQVQFAEQFSQIIQYFDHLNEIEIPEDIQDPSESHLHIGRPDQVTSSSVKPQDFSSYVTDQGFRVPKVVDAG